MRKSIIFVLIILFSLFSLTFLSVKVDAQTDSERMQNGLALSENSEIYDTVKALSTMPQTYEAYIKLPANYSGRGGIICGNYITGGQNSYLFELRGESTTIPFPQLHYQHGSSTTVFAFKNVDVRSDEYVHLAIVHDTTITSDGKTTAYCYVNGELKETVSAKYNTDAGGTGSAGTKGFTYVPTKTMRVGQDYRTWQASPYFKGNIKGIELYSDARTADEVKADSTRLLSSVSSDSNLLAAYNFTSSATTYKNDLSGNGYNLVYDSPAVSLEKMDGLTFEDNNRYVSYKKLTQLPRTVEAEIFVPSTYTDRAGVIVGNYCGCDGDFSFEVYSNGRLRFFYDSDEMNDVSFISNATDVRRGTWTHVAATFDYDNKCVKFYIDGALVDTVTTTYQMSDKIKSYNMVVGGDNRSGNAQYFKGAIKSVSMYSDVRTQAEINSGVNINDPNLISHYSMTKASIGKTVNDLSGHGYNLTYEQKWYTDKEPVTNYAYSFAVVGDTQILAEKYPDAMNGLYDWIVDNVGKKKIQHVFGLGDITQKWGANGDWTEWNRAKAAIGKLDGVVSYTLVRGNHDETTYMNATFASGAYMNQLSGVMKDGSVTNAYKTLRVGTTDYLFFALDYGISEEEMAWAGRIIEAHPNHKVVITTHCYMFRDGTTLGQNDACPPNDGSDVDNNPTKVYNDGEQIWNKFISKYGNIVLVLSGHDPCDDVVTLQTEGVHGNTVTQMLIDPQGMDAVEPLGMVCMLYFSEDGSKMEVEWYSTTKQMYYKTTNQYTIDISNEGNSAHQVSSQYKFNEYNHWKECVQGCVGYGLEVAPHTLDDEGKCVCGYVDEKFNNNDSTDENPDDNNNGNQNGNNNTTTNKPEPPQLRGCGGSIVASVIGVVSLMSLAIYAKKRKE